MDREGQIITKDVGKKVIIIASLSIEVAGKDNAASLRGHRSQPRLSLLQRRSKSAVLRIMKPSRSLCRQQDRRFRP